MKKQLVAINDLPPDGKEFELTDQEIWLEPIKEFKMDCRITEPIKGKVFVQRADEGVLVRGRLEGEVAVPCVRCAEDAPVHIDARFDEYEEIPPENAKRGDLDHGGYIVHDRHAPMLNLAEVGWEQFMLALPVQAVCREDCKGLCPTCGANLNESACGCEKTTVDPRMAPLSGLKIKKE